MQALRFEASPLRDVPRDVRCCNLLLKRANLFVHLVYFFQIFRSLSVSRLHPTLSRMRFEKLNYAAGYDAARVSFLETHAAKQSLKGHFPLVSGDVKSFYDHSVSIRVLEPHGGEFVFYIYNSYSPMFVRVTAPVEATYEPATRKERVKLPLKTAAGDAGTMTFSPHLPANHKP
jgi:hypothetical protein